MTHDEQKRAAQMAAHAVKDALIWYRELGKVLTDEDIQSAMTIAEACVMEHLTLQRIAREAGEYVAGSGMVN